MSTADLTPVAASPSSGVELPDAPARPVLDALRRRRALRGGLWQAIYITAGLALGLGLPELAGGPTVQSSSVRQLLFGLAGGLISFIALVFSLLFLVVQFSNSSISPRLTLFRDDPLVWHSFGFFAGLFVFCSTAGMRVGTGTARTSVVVAFAAVALVLIALGMSRALQLRALKLLQLTATMEEVRRRGEQLLVRLYTRPAPDAALAPLQSLGPGPPVDITWTRASTTLQHVDLQALLREAQQVDGVFRLLVPIGGELRRGAKVATAQATGTVAVDRVLRTFTTGADRTFAQDPLLAFRLLSDIGDRALSSAVNDPATAVQAIACLHDLLSIVVDKQLDLGAIVDDHGVARVVLPFPTWEDYLGAGVDEIAHYASRAPTVRERLRLLLVELADGAPDARREALARRLERLERLDIDTPGWPSSPVHRQEAMS